MTFECENAWVGDAMSCEVKAYAYSCDENIALSINYGNQLYSPYTRSKKCNYNLMKLQAFIDYFQFLLTRRFKCIKLWPGCYSN